MVVIFQKGSKFEMAIHILSGKNNLDTSYRESDVHSLPFKIHADCDAPVSKYFESYVKAVEDGTFRGSFRGFPLLGKRVEFPNGYIGAVLHESIKPSTDKDERKFYVVNNFSSIIYWNWDKKPSKNDVLMQALDWIDIAEALHSPIMEK